LTSGSELADADLARSVLDEDGQALARFDRRCRPAIEAAWHESHHRWGNVGITLADLVKDVRHKACVSYLRMAERHDPLRDPPLVSLQRFVEGLFVAHICLALGCSRGNARAWEVFHAAYADRLARATSRLMPRGDAAEEVLASFWGDLWLPRSKANLANALSSYGGRARLGTWLHSVLVFRIGDYYAAGRRRPVPLSSVDVEVDAVGAEALLGVSSVVREQPDPGGESPEVVADRLLLELERVIGGLGEDSLWLLREYYWRRRTEEEMGRELGVHRATICRRLQRLTARILDSLQQGQNASPTGGRQGEPLDDSLLRHLAGRLDLDELLGRRDR